MNFSFFSLRNLCPLNLKLIPFPNSGLPLRLFHANNLILIKQSLNKISAAFLPMRSFPNETKFSKNSASNWRQIPCTCTGRYVQIDSIYTVLNLQKLFTCRPALELRFQIFDLLFRLKIFRGI